MNLEHLRKFAINTSIEIFIGPTAIILIILFLSFTRIKNLFQRYKNTQKIANPPFVYLDGIFLFTFISLLLIFLFKNQSIPELSSEFKVFFVINSFFIVVWFLIGYFTKEVKEEKQEVLPDDTYSFTDNPIEFPKQDSLGRGKFIEGLYEEIININFTDSFVFGLHGSWGEGKTSVINLLRYKFRDNENFLIVNFEPWHYKDEEAMLTAFYEQIERAISQKFIFPHLKKTFTKYHKIITTGISYAGLNLDLDFKDEALDKIKQRIEKSISQSQKKILIIIDDIDRLQLDEILLIFKLVRLNTNFKNTIFILSFEPDEVQKHLKKINIDPEFLEKIVQKPITLPAIDQTIIDNFLSKHIYKIFDETKIAEKAKEELKEFPNFYQSEIRKLFKTLRDAKRYLNSLRSTLPPIKNEINLNDFLILELIKVFYLKIFRDIWHNPWFYIPLKWSDETFFLDPFSIVKEEHKYPEIAKHIEAITQSEKERETLIKMLKEMFPVVVNALTLGKTSHTGMPEYYRAQKRITHPECFRKYFQLQLRHQEMPDEFVESTLDMWSSPHIDNAEKTIEKTIFDIQLKGKLLEFLDKLLIFRHKMQRKTAIYLIRVIYKNIHKFSSEVIGTPWNWNSEYYKAEALLMLLINDKVENSEIQNIVEEVSLNTPYILFSVSIVLDCDKQRGGTSYYKICDNIKIDLLRNKVSERLRRYFVEEKRNVFDELKEDSEWGPVLYQWGTNWGTFEGNNSQIVNEYVFSLIKDNAKKFIKFLLHWKETAFPHENRFFNLDKFGKIYNLVEFKKIALKFKDSELLTPDERQEIGMFLETLQKKLDSEKESQK